jgi:acetylglutamate synthase
MISRVILCLGMAGVGIHGMLIPNPPPTPAQMQMQYKLKQLSNICEKKKKSPKVKELCKKWKFS